MSDEVVKPIIQEIEYGNIKIKLDDLMNERNITNYELSTKSNIRFQTIQGLREGSTTRIDFEVLAKICYALNCSVSDVMEYVPNEKSKD